MKMRFLAILESIIFASMVNYLFTVLKIDIFDFLDPLAFSVLLPPIVGGFWVTFRDGRNYLLYSGVIPSLTYLVFSNLDYFLHRADYDKILSYGISKDCLLGWPFFPVIIVAFIFFIGLGSGWVGAEAFDSIQRRSNPKNKNP